MEQQGDHRVEMMHVTRPVKPDELVAVVARVARPPQAGRPRYLDSQGFLGHLASRKRKGGARVSRWSDDSADTQGAHPLLLRKLENPGDLRC